MAKCGNCQFFGTAACNQNQKDRNNESCGDYEPVRGRKEDQKPKPLQKVCGITESGDPFEAVFHNGKPMFLIKTNNGFHLTETVINESHECEPNVKNIPYENYSYNGPNIPSREDLFWQARNEFDLFLDVESEYKEYLAACVLLSYQQEKVRTVPYPYFVGDNESGKSVGMQLLASLCYRPLFGITIPSSDIYGYLEDTDSPGVILEDEAQGFDRDLDKVKVYKSGYKRGAVVPRYREGREGLAMKYYRCYGFKAFASETMPQVKGFIERCVFIPMIEGVPKKDWADVNNEDEARLQQIRNDLLKWRLATRIGWILPEPSMEGIRGRVKELWKPVLQIVSGLTVEDSFRKFLQAKQRERQEEKENTLEYHVVKAVKELYEDTGNLEMVFEAVWNVLESDLRGTVDQKKPHVMQTPEFGDVTKTRIGYRLREILSGKRTVKREGKATFRVWQFNLVKLLRMVRKYGLDYDPKLPCYQVTNVTVSQKAETPKTMEKGMGNNVENKPSKTSTTSNNGNTVTSVSLDDLVSVSWSDSFLSEHECGVCGYKRMTSWQGETAKGVKIPVCEGCQREYEKKRTEVQ